MSGRATARSDYVTSWSTRCGQTTSYKQVVSERSRIHPQMYENLPLPSRKYIQIWYMSNKEKFGEVQHIYMSAFCYSSGLCLMAPLGVKCVSERKMVKLLDCFRGKLGGV